MKALNDFFGGNGPDQLLTIEEARALVKLSRTEFWRVRRRKKVKVHRIGRRVRILRSELIKFFDGEEE